MGEQESLDPQLPSTDAHDTDQERELTKSAAAESVSNIRNHYVTGPSITPILIAGSRDKGCTC